ncbi:Cytochrome b-c1 complex subunit 8 [Papilio xuthus]|uniref:Cytochrome b-c1 complex subunit 8 n=1 Tax=Papilio xuthus TaxID=66420 RepID=A0A194PEY7_PAPXU|nr:Cytochrome b-c1 complex subunit 8 [Papilio xuthus]
MGKQFGNLAFIRGILYFRLSPYEQRAYAGVLTKGLPNLVPRTLMTLPFWMPPFAFGALIYFYVDDLHRRSKRKNPKDYIDEVNPNPPPPPPPPPVTKC